MTRYPTVANAMRSSLARAAGVAAALLILAAPQPGAAQQVHLPRIGQQFISTGLTLQPGFLHDPNAPDHRSWGTVSATVAGTGRVGFHQIVTEHFMMAAEGDIGLQWFNEHTAETAGRADSEIAFSWQIGLVGRWLPFGERAGWALGGGPHLYNVYLADRTLQSLGLDVRTGRYLWQGTEQFLLLEIGYAVPFIQGLTRGNSYGGTNPNAVPKSWTFHRFSLSLQYGF